MGHLTPISPVNQAIGQLKFLGLAQIALVLICIALSWWAVQSVRWDLFLKHPKSPQAKMLQILLSLIIGFETARFLITYFGWSFSLHMLF